MQFQDLNAQKSPASRDYWLLKVRTLKVKDNTVLYDMIQGATIQATKTKEEQLQKLQLNGSIQGPANLAGIQATSDSAYPPTHLTHPQILLTHVHTHISTVVYDIQNSDLINTPITTFQAVFYQLVQ